MSPSWPEPDTADEVYRLFVSQHRNQLESSLVPEHMWPTLHRKLISSLFDAGTSFSLVKEEDEEGNVISGLKVVVIKDGGIKASSADDLYLTDHAWTFRPEAARRQVESYPGLLERLLRLFEVEEDAERLLLSREQRVDLVMNLKWRHAQTYSVGNASTVEGRMPVWYVLDEFASRIRHDDDPSFRMVPFLDVGDGCAYSVLFPTRDVDCSEEVTRDHLDCPEARNALNRAALKNILQEVDLTAESWRQEEPPEAFFTSSRSNESLPLPDAPDRPLPADRKIKVYAEYEAVVENLTHPRFQLVDDPDEADVLWLMSHFKDFLGLSRSPTPKRINQFPFESVVTVKDLLCVVCRRKGGALDWLPATFNLKTELPKFVSCFQHRAKLGLDNHWIVKPWNLARGLDTQVASSLPHVLKQLFSGPKIAQKYVSDPVLFERPGIGRVKFDVRYVLLLESVEPLKLHAYDRFWLRFANQPYELKDLDVYEKHFTVMNYSKEARLEQMLCQDFVEEFERQNPGFAWGEVQKDAFRMFREVFEGAAAFDPPRGIGKNSQSGAMYACDLMLSWERGADGKARMQPMLLEVNWGPDCGRACDLYPEFFNNVFSTLFLRDAKGQNVTSL